MGRIIDLLSEVATVAEEGPEGLVLMAEDQERFGSEWGAEELEDALGLVHDSLLQGELVEAADSLNARLLDVLGDFGEEASFARAAAGDARLSLETIGQLARRVSRLEEILEVYRDEAAPDSSGFDSLRQRLTDQGVEDEMMGDPDEPKPV